jgi:CRISPR type III-B/RAMP module-associated protein Cmr5
MKNLEQERAKNALEAANNQEYKFAGASGGDIVKKVPTMIMDNGILAAMAFAVEDRNKSGYEDVFKASIRHLGVNSSVKEFLHKLTMKDSSELRAVTSEIMAYLNYLRRFAKAK